MSARGVLIVDDEIIIARDLERMVRQIGVAETHIATDPDEALKLARLHRPRLALLDINLEAERDGIDLAVHLRRMLDCVILFITAHADSKTVARASERRPVNYLVKPFDERQVKIAVRLALEQTDAPESERKEQAFADHLTAAELRVLSMIAAGLTSLEIAQSLKIAKKTVENHRGNICRKLDLPRKQNSLLRFALQQKQYLSPRQD